MPAHLLKKGQLQIGESMIAIIMVMIVLVIVAVIAFNQLKGNYEVRLTEQQEINAVETAQFVTNLYELRCAKVGMKTACIDLYKAKAFKALDEGLDYYDQLRYATVTLEQVYPENEDISVILYHNSPLQSETAYETVTLIIPITIHDAVKDELSFGTLTIEKYQQVVS